MPIAGQRMRSSFTPTESGKLEPDLWLYSKDQTVGTTTRLHDDHIETLTFNDRMPRDRKVTSIIQVIATGQVFSATDEFQSVATQKAEALAGV